MTTVSKDFFGHHIVYLVAGHVTLTPWPTVLPAPVLRISFQPGCQWYEIETPSKGTFVWTFLDTFLNAAVAHGTKVLYTIDSCPSWARADHNTNLIPDNPTDGGDFITALLTHADSVSSGIVSTVEIFNEMGTGTGTNAQCAAFGTAIYNAVKAYNAAITVLAPSLGGGFVNDAQFAVDYGAAGGPFGDAMNYHGYSSSTATPAHVEAIWFDRTYDLIAIGQSADNTTRPVWLTETSDSYDAVGDYDAQRTARQLAKSYLCALGAGNVRHYWFIYEHRFGSPGADPGVTGMWDDNTFVITPAGTAFWEVYRWLADATIVSLPARIQLANQVPNPTLAGVVDGTPGTPPTSTTLTGANNGISRTIVSHSSGKFKVRFNGTAVAPASFTFLIAGNTAFGMPAAVGQHFTFEFDIQQTAGTQTGVADFDIGSIVYNNVGAAIQFPLDFFFRVSNNGQLRHVTLNTTATNAATAGVDGSFTIDFNNGAVVDITLEFSNFYCHFGTQWAGSFTRDGHNRQAVWDEYGSSSFTTPVWATRYRQLDGSTIFPGGTVTLSQAPIYFEDYTPPAAGRFLMCC